MDLMYFIAMSLVPFNLKMIAKKLDEVTRQLKFRGYFEFERTKNIENKQPIDFDKPVTSPVSILMY